MEPLREESSLDLLREAKAGSATALDSLLQRYVRRLRRWSSRRLPPWARSESDTDDLVQETLLNAFRNLQGIRMEHGASLRVYMRRAVSNRLRDKSRQVGRRAEEAVITDVSTARPLHWTSRSAHSAWICPSLAGLTGSGSNPGARRVLTGSSPSYPRKTSSEQEEYNREFSGPSAPGLGVGDPPQRSNSEPATISPRRTSDGVSAPLAKRPLRVLLVDDQILDDSVEVRSLRLAGYHVTAVQTGEMGLRLVERQALDVILLDLRLPGISGLQVLAELSRRNCRIPVIVLTGFGTVEIATLAMKLGAADFIQKPALLDSIEQALREVEARYPNGIEPTATSEADRVRTGAAWLVECTNIEEAAEIVVRLLLDGRITLRYFRGLARALRLLLTSEGAPLSPLLRVAQTAVSEGLNVQWPTDPGLLRVLSELEGRPKKQQQTAFARLLGWSRPYLSRRMMKATGHGPSDWCRCAALREALRALIQTTDTVSEVADRVGYEHVSQFDREFLTLYGIQPRHLRSRFAFRMRPKDTPD